MSNTTISPTVAGLTLTGIAPSFAIQGFLRGPTRGSAGLAVSAMLNVLNAQVVKAAPGILVRVVVVAAGSGGSLTLNDSATLAGAATGNEILTIAYGSLSAGQMLQFDWPCAAGICISAVPSGTPQFSLSFT
jgi:hypothetical protein